jgi:hypothetical protein
MEALEEEETEIEVVPSKKRKIRRSYTLKEKLEAMDYAQKHSIKGASLHFKVDRKRIREWKDQKDELKKKFIRIVYNFITQFQLNLEHHLLLAQVRSNYQVQAGR